MSSEQNLPAGRGAECSGAVPRGQRERTPDCRPSRAKKPRQNAVLLRPFVGPRILVLMMNLSSVLLGTLLLGQIMSSKPFLMPLTRSRSSSSASVASSISSSSSSPAIDATSSRASSSRKALPVLTAPAINKVTPSSKAPTAPLSPKPNPATVRSDLDRARADALDLVNAERALLGIAPLRYNALLEQAAQAHADDMAARQYFAHVTPDGKSPLDRITATGYFNPPCADCLYSTAYAENIGKAQRTPSEIVKAWMHSDEHRKNILNRDLTETGLGYASGNWVQVFGSVKVK